MRTRPLGDALTLDVDEVKVEPTATYEVAGVYSFGRGLFHRETLTGDETSYAVFNRLHSNQVVLSRLFAFEGALAVVPPSLDGHFVSKEFPTFRASEAADVGYLRHVFRWPELWEHLADRAGGLGVRRRRVHAEQFLSVEIPLPEIEEQRRIAARLDRLFEQVDRLAELRHRREELLIALPPALAHRADVDAAAKEVAGWRLTRLAEVLEPTEDPVVVEPTATYVPAGIYSFGRGLFKREPITGIDTKYRTFNRLSAGELILSRLNGWEGAVDVVDTDFEGCVVSQEYPTFTVDEKHTDLRYLRARVQSPDFWDLLQVGTRGSMIRRKRVSAEHLLTLELWLPPIDEQRRIGALTERLDDAACRAESTAPPAEALRTAILEQALAAVE